VCNAVKNVQVLEAEKRRTNDERRTTNERMICPNFRDLIGTNSDRLVRIPIDWSESRTIGPNSERMTNDEVDVATDVNAFDVVKFAKVSNAQKKIGVD
jgi:hypothetical protein